MNPFVINLLKPLKLELDENQPVVCVSEEFGFRYHIWLPDMNCQELESWWRRQWKFNKLYFSPTKIKKGKWITEDSKTFVLSIIDATANPDDWNIVNPVIMNVWNSLRNSKLCYYSHFFDDEDSFLETPKGKIITHMGRNPARATTEKYFKEQYPDVNR